MALSRRREKDQEAKKKQDRRASRDPFAHLEDDRTDAESGDPWFLGPDDGPELHVETGISSNLSEDDLETH
jgi:hypothetical protein